MTGILAASLPTYRPLYRRLVYGSATVPTQTGTWRPNAYGSDSISNETPLGVKISSGGNHTPLTQGSGINVTNQVEMTVYTAKRNEDTGRRYSDEERLTSG